MKYILLLSVTATLFLLLQIIYEKYCSSDRYACLWPGF